MDDLRAVLDDLPSVLDYLQAVWKGEDGRPVRDFPPGLPEPAGSSRILIIVQQETRGGPDVLPLTIQEICRLSSFS